MTGTIVAPAGSWSCVSHHQSPVFISLYILRLSESARHAGSKSRSAWNGRCAKRNCIHLKISLWYNVPNMCEWSSIQLLLLSPELSLEWSFRRASADCNDSMLKLSSPRRRCWSIHIFVCWLNDWACWKWCADWKGCHGFHCSEYLRCLLYNPVALPYAFPPRVLHSNYLPMSPRLCWIRGKSQIRFLGVNRFFVGSIFRWWCSRYIVYG